MATDIDSLQIKINGTAQGANKSVNQLIKNLDKLQSKLSGLDTSKLNSFANNSTKASNSSKKLSSSLNTLSVSATRSQKSFKGLASAFGRFYANYFLVVRGIKGLWSSVESTANYIESFNYYTVAFGKIASEWDKDWENYGSENARNYSNAFVTSMNSTLEKLSGVKLSIGEDGQGLLTTTGGSNLGLNIQEITQYASQLASVTNSLGQTGKTSLAISSSFTKLAGDISSLFNVDYSTVAKNLQSGLIGQSRALYKYGIDITNATLQTYAYELGIEKAVSEMSQMEKQQLRVLAILDQSEVAFGDLANTINSPSNMIRQMTNNFKEASIILGQLFMPVVENVLPMVNGFSIALKRLLTDIAGFMGITIDMDAYGQGFMETEDAIDGITDGLDEAVESSNKLLNNLRGFDKLNVISTKSGTSSSGLGGAIDLTNQIVAATEEYEKKWQEAFDKMENKAELFANKISSLFAKTSNTLNISEILGLGEEFGKSIDWETIGANLTGLLSLIGNIISDLSSSFVNITNNISPKLIETINNISSAFGSFLVAIEPISDFVADNLLPIFEKFSSFLINNLLIDFNLWVNNFKADMDGLTGFVKNAFAGNWEEAWNSIGQTFTQKWDNMVKTVTDHWEEIKEFIGLNDLLDVLEEQFGKDKVEAVFSAIPEVFESIWKNAINGAISLFNSFIDYLNTKLTIKWDGFNFMGQQVWDSGSFKLFEIPNIPMFELGGFPEDGLFFANRNELVGQFSNGQTAVANNEQITKGISDAVYPAVYNAIMDAFGGNRNAQKVIVQIDGREVFSVVRSEASNYTRRTGQPAFG